MIDAVQGPAGKLQVLVEEPDRPPTALAVICHPHPLHGGSLTNKIVHQLARTFREQGAVSVRFNFRGVGESEGVYDEGNGELDDALAVTEQARREWPEPELWLAGFSFGGSVAIRAAVRTRPERLVTVAPAVNYFGVERPDLRGSDWLLIQGSDDEVVPADSVLGWAKSLEYRPDVVVVEGASHFFHGRLNDLKQVILERWPAA